MADFYNWDEIDINDEETFCWRQFNIIKSDNGKMLLPIPDGEKIGPYLTKDIISGILKM